METAVIENSEIVGENNDFTHESKGGESSENFQKFIYQLFEKNGIINDMRAYLRGHIVNVLKSTQTGAPLSCQKHFTERLGLSQQAMNILIAEYLLHLEFSYTLSVFVSEIPLANMVFEFAKSLMSVNQEETSELKFNDKDVWCILNYLGVKCDSDHATNVVHMYRNEEKTPLLLCIINSLQLYKKDSNLLETGTMSDESVHSPPKSSASLMFGAPEQCRHYSVCKSCQGRFARIKYKKNKRKRVMAEVQGLKSSSISTESVEKFMKNVNVMERNLINEMFEQLKSVYESEVAMVRTEEENRVKGILAKHALALQRKRDEMEERYRLREEELERAVAQKKRFLWGLARGLRDQHRQMSAAMLAVRQETDRLTTQEVNLKTKLIEAGQIVKKRGESMRTQIADELQILEEHLETLKREREEIDKEKTQLEEIKGMCDTNSNIMKIINSDAPDNLKSPFEVVKEEIAVLKKYLETTRLEAKCVVEKCTMTEKPESSKTCLNNKQDADRSPNRDEDRNMKPPNTVLNDFKKEKNVNFVQMYTDDGHSDCNSGCNSASSPEGGGGGGGRSPSPAPSPAPPRLSLERLKMENNALRAMAQQHVSQIASLSSELAAAVRRPAVPAATAYPRQTPIHTYTELLNGRRIYPGPSASALGWRLGAGEELGLSAAGAAPAPPPAPGDVLPFIGALKDRHGDSRRRLIHQWRALRRRYSPQSAVRRLRAETQHMAAAAQHAPRANSAGPPGGPRPTSPAGHAHTPSAGNREPTSRREGREGRESSPAPMLKDTQNKIKNTKTKPHFKGERDKSPNAVLREAKLRLRKLEIEAEAVERSYADFRKRQHALRDKARGETDGGQKLSAAAGTITCYQVMDYDKYFRDCGNPLLRKAPNPPQNKSSVDLKPEDPPKDNFVEQSIAEFRKLYRASAGPATTEPEDIEVPKTGSQILREKDMLARNWGAMHAAPAGDAAPPASPADPDLLRLEVDAGSAEGCLPGDLTVVVQGAVGSEEECPISTHMTILISPKRSGSNSGAARPRSVSPEQAARLTRNDVLDALFRADGVEVMSSQELARPPERDQDQDYSTSEVGRDPDEYSADDAEYMSSDASD